ncbi:hypothetical protein JW868_01440, partial [Candidatus Woesearchaeota archaeon]|nr:hypothetical protein [Candidatus Woesearchaeota archaeon]
LYWDFSEDIEGVELNDLQVSTLDNLNILYEAIPMGILVVDEDSPIERVDVEYKLAGHPSTELVLYKYKETTHYSNGEDRVREFEAPEVVLPELDNEALSADDDEDTLDDTNEYEDDFEEDSEEELTDDENELNDEIRNESVDNSQSEEENEQTLDGDKEPGRGFWKSIGCFFKGIFGSGC